MRNEDQPRKQGDRSSHRRPFDWSGGWRNRQRGVDVLDRARHQIGEHVVYYDVERVFWSEVGTAFLRVRPWFVGVALCALFPTLWTSGAPPAQCAAVACGCTAMLSFFIWEAWQTRTKLVSEGQFFRSLAVTILGISMACIATGGVRSPMVPMLFAPIVTAFAAFGSDRPTHVLCALFGTIWAAMLLLPNGVPWPPLPPTTAAWATGISVVVSLGLLFVSVTGLTRAYRRSGAALDRVRLHVLHASQDQLHDWETMASRVSHELNNPLTSMKALAQLMHRKAPDGSREQRRLSVLCSEVERMQAIVEDYRSMHRPIASLNTSETHLNRVCMQIVDLVGAQANARAVDVFYEETQDAHPSTCQADPHRLEQAVLNLVLNAIDACTAREHPTGRVALRVRRQRGDLWTIEVEDNGVGMQPETLQNARRMYFTTKSQGTGLGLCVADAVARQHGGSLDIESTPHEGTTVRLWLPSQPPKAHDDPHTRNLTAENPP